MINYNNIDQDKAEITEFIYKLFSYYNGRINLFNPAKLNIDWALHEDSTKGGSTTNPNIVTIFPRVIQRFYSNINDIKFSLLVCVIHELFHVDQYIDYIKLEEDKEYYNIIDNTVEMETYLYITNHRQELKDVFNINIEVPYGSVYEILYNSGYETGQLYNRRTYLSHMVSILIDILHSSYDQTINTFVNVFNDSNTNIYITFINSKIQFALKLKDMCMPIMQLNNILEDNFFKYNFRGASVCMIKHDEQNYEISIDAKCSNILYRLVNINNNNRSIC